MAVVARQLKGPKDPPKPTKAPAQRPHVNQGNNVNQDRDDNSYAYQPSSSLRILTLFVFGGTR